jgi:hypothetical protein
MRVYKLLALAMLGGCRPSNPATDVGARPDSASREANVPRERRGAERKLALESHAFCAIDGSTGLLRCGGNHGAGEMMAGPGSRSFVSDQSFGCAVTADRSLRCWGRMSAGGVSFPAPPERRPEAVEGATDIDELYGGSGSLLARTRAGRLLFVFSGPSDALRPRVSPVSGIERVQRFEWLIPGRSGVARDEDGRWFRVVVDPDSGSASARLLRDAGDVTEWTHGEAPCARRSDETVACLQSSPRSDALTVVRGLTGVTRLFAPHFLSLLTCAQTRDGRVFCWDRPSSEGRYGAGGVDFRRGLAEIPSFRGARDVAIQRGTVCAALADGAVGCINLTHSPPSSWSLSLGDDRSRFVGFRPVAGLANVERLEHAASDNPGFCAVGRGARARCFAITILTEDANATTALASLERERFESPSALHLEVGHGNARCQQRPDGSVRCTPTIVDRVDRAAEDSARHGVAVFGIGDEPVFDVALGRDGGCAIMDDRERSVRCWGKDASDATAVEGLTGARSIAVGLGFRCALDERGAVRCWGDGRLGQRGDGLRGIRATPDTMAIPEGATQISAGAAHACALLRDKTVRCWGWNGLAQLGDRTRDASASPVTVEGLGGVRSIGVGDAHACALLEDGSVRCWGGNTEGQCGAGDYVNQSPVRVDVAAGARSLVVAANSACLRYEQETGSVRCFGGEVPMISQAQRPRGWGLLRDASFDESWLARFTPLDGAGAVFLGKGIVCVTLATGAVRCMSDELPND